MDFYSRDLGSSSDSITHLKEVYNFWVKTRPLGGASEIHLFIYWGFTMCQKYKYDCRSDWGNSYFFLQIKLLLPILGLQNLEM